MPSPWFWRMPESLPRSRRFRPGRRDWVGPSATGGHRVRWAVDSPDERGSARPACRRGGRPRPHRGRLVAPWRGHPRPDQGRVSTGSVPTRTPCASSFRVARLSGYLTREDAIAYRPVIAYAESKGRKIACHARIGRGRDCGARRQGFDGVVLQLGSPMETMLELVEDTEDDLKVRTDAPMARAPRSPSRATADACWEASRSTARCPSRSRRVPGSPCIPVSRSRVQLLVDCDSDDDVRQRAEGRPVRHPRGSRV